MSRLRVALALCIAIASASWAQETTGSLGTCTTGTCSLPEVVVNNLWPTTYTVKVTAGTIAAGEVLCKVAPGSTALPVKNIVGAAATFTADTVFSSWENCYSVQLSMTCTGCTTTAFYHGSMAPR